MLSEFRSRYPTGSLISDLLTIYQGKYVVRAVVQVDGTTLVTGLAARDSLEEAEDQARQRALALLGIQSATPAPISPVLHQTPSVAGELQEEWKKPRLQPSEFSTGQQAQKGYEPSPVVPANEGTYTRLPAQYPGNTPTPSAPTTASDWFSSPGHDASWEPEASFEAPSVGEKAGSADPLQVSRFPSTGRVTDSRTGSDNTGLGHADMETPETPPTAPVDLSDVINQTNVEIKRLRWSTEQGRTYLEDNYNGKRSRSLLSPDELRDFLERLKALPTPPN